MVRPQPSSLSRSILLLLTLSILLPTASALFFDPVPSYCKYQSKPCLSCTRQFCLDQKLAICKGAEVPELDTDVGTGTEGDVEARCFKRDSPRNQLIVTFFILVVIGLLLFAGIRSRLQKAIEERGTRPTDLREWSQALLPTQLQPLSTSLFGRARTQGLGFDMRTAGGMAGDRGDYAPVSVGS